MIDLEKCGKNTEFILKINNVETKMKLDNLCINGYGGDYYNVYVYAYEFCDIKNNYFDFDYKIFSYDISADKKMCDIRLGSWASDNDNLEDIDEIGENDTFEIEILVESKEEPEIYVDFNMVHVPVILENKLSIYHDYMDQGFGETSMELTISDFHEDEKLKDGASVFCGDPMWISKDDYDEYFRNDGTKRNLVCLIKKIKRDH